MFNSLKKKLNLRARFGLAADNLPQTDFASYLKRQFGRKTAAEVLAVFDNLGLPAPQDDKEFLKGFEGGLVLVSTYGVVIRIEGKKSKGLFFKADRINDNPFILQPLGSISAGKAVVEVCPGCYPENDERLGVFLTRQLEQSGINFWDNKISNVGRLPVATPSFPEGLPVVYDRLAVRHFSPREREFRAMLPKLEHKFEKAPPEAALDKIAEAQTAQQALYAPLQQAFVAAWPTGAGTDQKKKEIFWSLCAQALQNGELVAGWTESASVDKPAVKSRTAIDLEAIKNLPGVLKAAKAPETAENYGARLRQKLQP